MSMDDQLRKLPKESRSMKKMLIILAAAALLLSIIAVVVLLVTRNDEDVREDLFVINVDTELDSVQVSVFNEGIFQPRESFTLVNKQGLWRFAEDESIELNQSAARSIPSATFLRASRIIEEAPSQQALDAYGLANPERRIVFDFVDDSKITLLLGNRVSAKGGFYAKLEGDPKVYLISDVDGEKLSIKKTQLRNMPSLASSVLISAIQEFKITRDNVEYEYSVLGNRGSEFNRWQMLQPHVLQCDDEAVETYLTELASLSPAEYVDDQENVDEFGLDNPRLKVYIKSYELEFEMAVGALTDDGKYRYCTFGDGPVYLIDNALLDSIEKLNVYTLAQKEIIYYDVQYLNEIIFFDADGDLARVKVTRRTVEEDGKKKEITEHFLDGKLVDNSQFAQLYFAMLTSTYDGVLDPGYQKGALVFGYTLKLEDKDVTVEFREYNANSKAVSFNGKEVFYIQNVQFNQLKEKAELFIAGELIGSS
ncbi:MAG TPA: DUF4340 domain-containing protein [Clostridia bacterium]|nr:DUF4340 domain-containing protein [Clostridia bacterium]